MKQIQTIYNQIRREFISFFKKYRSAIFEFFQVFFFFNISITAVILSIIVIIILLNLGCNEIINIQGINEIIPSLSANKNIIIATVIVLIGSFSVSRCYNLILFFLNLLSKYIFRSRDRLTIIYLISKYIWGYLLLNFFIIVPIVCYFIFFSGIELFVKTYYLFCIIIMLIYLISVWALAEKSSDFMLLILRKVISGRKAYLFPFEDLAKIFNIISCNQSGELCIFNSSILYENDSNIYENIRRSIVQRGIKTNVFLKKTDEYRENKYKKQLEQSLGKNFSHKEVQLKKGDSYLAKYKFACFSKSLSAHHNEKYDDWILIKIDIKPFATDNRSDDIMMLAYKKESSILRDRFRNLIQGFFSNDESK